MKQFQTEFTGTHRTNHWRAVPRVVVAWISVFAFTANGQSPRNLDVQMPSVPGYVANGDMNSVGTLKLKARGLLPNTAFRVFLATDFLGEIATNTDGRGSMRARTLVEDDWLRMNLRSAVLRFKSPSSDDVCFAPDHNEVERISLVRRNGSDRRVPSATTTFITSTRSMNDDGSILHSINWRSIPCVSTF